MPPPALTPSPDVAAYPALFRRVKEALLEGRRRIEAEKVRTYWETGRLIQTHILANNDRADYGAELFIRLAKDLEVGDKTLYRCVQFFLKYPNGPIFAASRKLGWGHIQELIAISDDKQRKEMETAIYRNGLTIDEVRARKNALRMPLPAAQEGPASIPGAAAARPLLPLRGELYTYKILEPGGIVTGVESGLVIDLGFSVTRTVEAKLVSNFNDGDIIASISRDGSYRFSKADRTARDLYTYNACIEKVVDGDTLKARIDLGFDVWIKQTLRLRGIDCPELKTRSGDAAKAYVQSLVKEADRIVVRSSKSDKYDRYLADIFIPSTLPERGEVYLNALLIEQGHAERWE